MGSIISIPSGSICSIFSFRAELLENRNLSNSIEIQGNAAKELVEEIDIRHNHALLVQKVGQITSTLMDIDQLTTNVMRIIKTHLDFDRGLILLANKESSHLFYQSGFRYTDINKTHLLDAVSPVC